MGQTHNTEGSDCQRFKNRVESHFGIQLRVALIKSRPRPNHLRHAYDMPAFFENLTQVSITVYIVRMKPLS